MIDHLDREQIDKLDKETLTELLWNALSRIDELEKQVASQTQTIKQLQEILLELN